MLEVQVIASGSDGNCTVIQLDDEAIMIDAGLSYSKTHKLLEREGVDESAIKALLVTHEHADHVNGVGPIARKLGIPVYCNPATLGSFNPGSVDFSIIQTLQRFRIGKNILVATDTGKFTFPLRQALEDADFAIVEANYDNRMLHEGPYPEPLKRRIAGDHGHMCNADSAREIKNTALKPDRTIFLGHLSKHNNTPDIARDTVAEYTGIKRYKIDCLEFLGDREGLLMSKAAIF